MNKIFKCLFIILVSGINILSQEKAKITEWRGLVLDEATP